MLGTNLFAYCENNPVNFLDLDGTEPIAVGTAWSTTMWWLTLADGALPFGDIIYFIGCAVTASAIAVLIPSASQSSSGKDYKHYNQPIIDAGSSTAVPPPPNDPRGRNRQKVNERYLERELKKQHTNPHSIKHEYLGRRTEVSRYDIYVDKGTGQLAIFTHSTKELIEVTTYFI